MKKHRVTVYLTDSEKEILERIRSLYSDSGGPVKTSVIFCNALARLLPIVASYGRKSGSKSFDRIGDELAHEINCISGINADLMGK